MNVALSPSGFLERPRSLERERCSQIATWWFEGGMEVDVDDIDAYKC